jgi:hypothetical protein
VELFGFDPVAWKRPFGARYTFVRQVDPACRVRRFDRG